MFNLNIPLKVKTVTTYCYLLTKIQNLIKYQKSSISTVKQINFHFLSPEDLSHLYNFHDKPSFTLAKTI